MKCELIYSSDYEEFFYKEDDTPVSEGQPIGVEIESEKTVDFFVFDHIYWDLRSE